MPTYPPHPAPNAQLLDLRHPPLPGDSSGPSPWTSRSPSAASARKRSSDASRASSAQHRLNPHSCAMTGSTRPHRRGLQPPAVGVSRLGAGSPLLRTRTGAPRVQVRTLAEGLRWSSLTSESPGNPFVKDLPCADSASYAHNERERSSLVPLSLASDIQRLSHRSEAMHTSKP